MTDDERNRLSARAARYAQVGAKVGGVAARMAGARLRGREVLDDTNAAAFTAALGSLKGPMMKVAQFLATIPGALPQDLSDRLRQLQSNAPPMGAGFVNRRMMAELGAGWRGKFAAFDLHPAHAASLGQVHRATSLDGKPLACKLQYPDMTSVVEADLQQLDILFALRRRLNTALDTREAAKEIGARLREELDYQREAKHVALYREILGDSTTQTNVRVPGVWPELSTRRLITLDWLDGEPLLDFKTASQDARNAIATAMFRAWWHPFIRLGIIHGDPHLGNYTVFRGESGEAAGINLLDYGCIRVFPPSFVKGVVDLYRGLRDADEAAIAAAYETWGFRGLSKDLRDVLNIWSRFIYGPLLDDRVRPIADGVSPAEYGRTQASRVHEGLKQHGPVTVPREFVFMDRAAIGLGGAFLHLDARLNFYAMFNDALADFSVEGLAERQAAVLRKVGLSPPA
ncbi:MULTISPECIES: AarF/ABC1/UbiB kinase family protein [unclassified Beijerinckia]|uniref:ABC1 kinase family protein n=1 Tax=unclassified Beijerinckia TaxID=2638183 RepID=UPI000894B139|nr:MULTISPECIES: AarF/ABC1/UbiB kinase family protein [unclassified Beijerinckia]MDH7798522.1 putative unusual protein kinase regulating ubiquinone biosynthesis (AarF/ABC1/UbiB family) [Beijerinckia sp. GAS462]SED23686.1 Predicted unusual protein kinase regulating ubiquinone biosynthesis, AarF/ABC1/UbiB family [Beijerinckia sp. 28-YEA-48]